jgi:hypothetical protein
LLGLRRLVLGTRAPSPAMSAKREYDLRADHDGNT